MKAPLLFFHDGCGGGAQPLSRMYLKHHMEGSAGDCEAMVPGAELMRLFQTIDTNISAVALMRGAARPLQHCRADYKGWLSAF